MNNVLRYFMTRPYLEIISTELSEYKKIECINTAGVVFELRNNSTQNIFETQVEIETSWYLPSIFWALLWIGLNNINLIIQRIEQCGYGSLMNSFFALLINWIICISEVPL